MAETDKKKTPPRQTLRKGGAGTVSLRVRVSVEVHEELQRRMDAKTQLSDLVEAACRQAYLPGGMEASLEGVHKSLLWLNTRSRQHEVKQQVLLETLLLSMRTWLMAMPGLSEEEKEAARPSADLRLNNLMDVVANTVGRRQSVIGGSVRLTDVIFGPEPGTELASAPGDEADAAEEEEADDA